MTPTLQWILFVMGAYLVGAIPFGLLIARSRGVDLRAHGSGNIGATNVLRVLGVKAGILCFTLDALKGALPVLLAGYVMGVLGDTKMNAQSAIWWLGVAMASVLGHMFTVFANLRGGKGVATGFGALGAMFPIVTPAALLALVAWIITLKATRFVSVASCLAALVLPIGLALARFVGIGSESEMSGVGRVVEVWPFLAVTGLLAVLVIYKHRGNLARVRARTEPRVGGRRGSTQREQRETEKAE